MIRLSIKALQQIEHTKPPGYLDDVKSKGNVHGDNIDLDEEVYGELRKKYSPQTVLKISPKSAKTIDSSINDSQSLMLLVKQFMDASIPAPNLPGIEELRAAFFTEFESAAKIHGPNCCTATTVKTKYTNLIINLLKQIK